MVCLPTFTIKIGQMQVNVPYLDPMGMGLRFENLRCSFNVHKRNAMSMSECALSTYV